MKKLLSLYSKIVKDLNNCNLKLGILIALKYIDAGSNGYQSLLLRWGKATKEPMVPATAGIDIPEMRVKMAPLASWE